MQWFTGCAIRCRKTLALGDGFTLLEYLIENHLTPEKLTQPLVISDFKKILIDG